MCQLVGTKLPEHLLLASCSASPNSTGPRKKYQASQADVLFPFQRAPLPKAYNLCHLSKFAPAKQIKSASHQVPLPKVKSPSGASISLCHPSCKGSAAPFLNLGTNIYKRLQDTQCLHRNGWKGSRKPPSAGHHTWPAKPPLVEKRRRKMVNPNQGPKSNTGPQL